LIIKSNNKPTAGEVISATLVRAVCEPKVDQCNTSILSQVRVRSKYITIKITNLVFLIKNDNFIFDKYKKNNPDNFIFFKSSGQFS
jgi:hypothetical protein